MMAGALSREYRSWKISRNPREHTQPELSTRDRLHRMRYHYHLHGVRLSGSSPDLILPKYRMTTTSKSCFWRRYLRTPNVTTPETSAMFSWRNFYECVWRDQKKSAELKGYSRLVVIAWQCKFGCYPTRSINGLCSPLRRSA